MVGTDIVQIARIDASCRSSHFRERIFTAAELAYWQQKGQRAETLAGMFAAKEAVSKALGTGISGFCMTDVEVTHNADGKPEVVLKNKALKLAGQRTVHISISHDGDYAIAMAVIL